MKKFAALMIALVFALSCVAFAEEESYTIGIAQFAEHGSLDNCREGFLAGLAEEGIVEGENLTVEYQNAQADTSMATTIASNFVANGYDLIAKPVAGGFFHNFAHLRFLLQHFTYCRSSSAIAC